MLSLLARWRAIRARRKARADAARRAYIAHPTRAGKRELAQLRAELAAADRVVARHAAPVGVSSQLVQLIAGFEGGRSPDGLFHPYWDRGGNCWTIGYGHTEGVGLHSAPLTAPAALALLRLDLDHKYAPPVLRWVPRLGLDQHELDALVDLVYNCGAGVLDAGRTMGNALRSGRRDQIAAAFGVYVKDANGRVEPGLVRRRFADRALFVGGHR